MDISKLIQFLDYINQSGHTKMNIRLLLVMLYAYSNGCTTNQQTAELLESHVSKAKDLLGKACDRGLFYRSGLTRVSVTSYRGTPDNMHQRHNNVQIYKLTDYSKKLIKNAEKVLE